MAANVTASITGEFSRWVKVLFAMIRAAPWLFRWIGEDRIANFVVKYGFRIVAK
jgi:hypothetical protein